MVDRIKVRRRLGLLLVGLLVLMACEGDADQGVTPMLTATAVVEPTISVVGAVTATAEELEVTVTPTVTAALSTGEEGLMPSAVPVFEPFGTVTVAPDFIVDGQGRNIDSIAFWEAPEPAETLMFVTGKGAPQLVEVWQYPFVDRELSPLQHSSFGEDVPVNGVVVDQADDLLYVSVAEPASTVAVFALPSLQFVNAFINGSVNLRGEPNITLLNRENGEKWVYVSADTIVYIRHAGSGAAIGQFRPAEGLETLAADDFYQLILIPDENDRSGIYAYEPEGEPYERNGRSRFGGDGIFQSDGEGILLYACLSSGQDNGTGFIVAVDQKNDVTDFEFFHRQTWEHLGVLNIEGVANTDGIGSTQQPLPDYPLGLFAAVHDDTATAGVGWDKILAATGLSCDHV